MYSQHASHHENVSDNMSSPASNLKKVKRCPLPGNRTNSVPFRDSPNKPYPHDEPLLSTTHVTADPESIRQPDCIDDDTQRVIVEEIKRHTKVGGAQRHASSDTDLLVSMATRLRLLEKELLSGKREIVVKNQHIKDMEDRVAKLEKLLSNSHEAVLSQTYQQQLEQRCLALQTQVEEMEEFLNDYGMIWIGQEVTPERGNSITSNCSTHMWSPDESVAKESMVNFDLIVKHVHMLNNISDKTVVKATHQGATLQPLDVVPLTLFQNGLVLFQGPFRPYSDPDTQRCVQDLTDGYFPSELKSRYPEGVPFQLNDCRDTTFHQQEYRDIFPGSGKQLGGYKGPSRLLDTGKQFGDKPKASQELTTLPGPKLSLEVFLTRLPASIVKGGRVVAIRSGVADTLKGDTSGSQVTLVETPVLQELKTRLEVTENERPPTPAHVITLRVKSENGDKTYVLKMKQSDTIGKLRQYLNKLRGSEGVANNYQLKSSFPLTTYSDLSRTLSDYGLESNTKLFMAAMQ